MRPVITTAILALFLATLTATRYDHADHTAALRQAVEAAAKMSPPA